MPVFSASARAAYSNLYALPDYVKSASEVCAADLKDLPRSAFADSLRKLPMHTKAAVWLSALEHYYRSDATPDAEVDRRLTKAAEFFGVADDLRMVKASSVLLRGKAPGLTANDYAISRSANQVYRLPIDTPEHTVKASMDLQHEAGNYPYAWRKEAALRILGASGRQNVKLPNRSYIEKAAGMGSTTPDVLINALNLRKHALIDRRSKQALDNTLTSISRGFRPDDAVPPSLLSNVAEVLDRCDRIGGLQTKYSSEFKTPEEICFAESLSDLREKRAKYVSFGDWFVEREKLASVDSARMTVLGEHFANYLDDGRGKIDPTKFEKIASEMSESLCEAAKRQLPFALSGRA